MEKRLILLLLFILSGCNKEKITICEKRVNDVDVTIFLYSKDGLIYKSEINKSFRVPLKYLLDDNNSDVYNQIKNSCEIDNDIITLKSVSYYEEPYYLSKNKDYLNENRFFCKE